MPEFDSAEQKAEYQKALETERLFREQTGRDTKGVDAEMARVKKQKRPAGEDASGGEE